MKRANTPQINPVAAEGVGRCNAQPARQHAIAVKNALYGLPKRDEVLDPRIFRRDPDCSPSVPSLQTRSQTGVLLLIATEN